MNYYTESDKRVPKTLLEIASEEQCYWLCFVVFLFFFLIYLQKFIKYLLVAIFRILILILKVKMNLSSFRHYGRNCIFQIIFTKILESTFPEYCCNVEC